MQKKLKLYAFILLRLEKFRNRLCNRNKVGRSLQAFVRRALFDPTNIKLFFHVTYPCKEIRRAEELIDRITGNSKDHWKSWPRIFNEILQEIPWFSARKKKISLDLETCANFLNSIHQTLHLKLLG